MLSLDSGGVEVKRVSAVIVFLIGVNTHADCVVLLHGLARTDKSMVVLESRLKENNYHTVNVAYASRKFSIETLADKAIRPALAKCPDKQKVNFVTHSMGGILVRQYLNRYDIPMLGSVVMLGPPNQGSEVVDKLGKFPGFRFFNGDAGLQLGTGKLSVPNKLGAVDYDVGVIAGNKSINWLLSSLIPGKDDGKVSVARTKVDGMKEHIVVPSTHTFMMRNKHVIEQVVFYLKQGRFKR